MDAPLPSPAPQLSPHPVESLQESTAAQAARNAAGSAIEAYLNSSDKPALSVPTKAPAHSTHKLPAPPQLVPPPGDKATRWAWLAEQLRSDTVWQSRGDPTRALLLDSSHLEASFLCVGDHPSQEEEAAGLPFADAGGEIFLKILKAMGLGRDQALLTHALPWRPATGDPQAQRREVGVEEIHYALPFLAAQIDIVQPRFIIALGSTAAKALLGTANFKNLAALRGTCHRFQQIPLIVSYHPNYLKLKESESKNSAMKAKRAAWEDMLLLMREAGLPISPKQQAFFTQS